MRVVLVSILLLGAAAYFCEDRAQSLALARQAEYGSQDDQFTLWGCIAPPFDEKQWHDAAAWFASLTFVATIALISWYVNDSTPTSSRLSVASKRLTRNDADIGQLDD